MKKINVVQCPSEIGAGTRGASLGPKALQINAFEQNFPLFDQNRVKEIPVPQVQAYHAREASINYSHEFVTLYENIYNHFAQDVSLNQRHLILTGDHSSAGAFLVLSRISFLTIIGD